MSSALIVIPTLNEANNLDRVVAELIPGCEGIRVKLIIVDGGSTDATWTAAERLSRRDPRISVIRNPQKIQSVAVNIAVKAHSSGFKYIIRCDAHCVYPRDFVKLLVYEADRRQATSIVVPMVTIGYTTVQRAVSAASNSLLGTGGSSHRMGGQSGYVEHGHHALFRRDVFLALKGYDESFITNEDAEFDARLVQNGHRPYLLSECSVRYIPRASIGALARQYYKYGLGRARTAVRHPSSIHARQLIVPAFVVAAIISVLMAALNPVFLTVIGIYAAGLVLTSMFAQNSSVYERALIGVVLPTMHFAWAAGFVVGLILHRDARANCLMSQ